MSHRFPFPLRLRRLRPSRQRRRTVAIEGSHRKPPGHGPLPAVMIVHGGLDTQRSEKRACFCLMARCKRDFCRLAMS